MFFECIRFKWSNHVHSRQFHNSRICDVAGTGRGVNSVNGSQGSTQPSPRSVLLHNSSQLSPPHHNTCSQGFHRFPNWWGAESDWLGNTYQTSDYSSSRFIRHHFTFNLSPHLASLARCSTAVGCLSGSRNTV